MRNFDRGELLDRLPDYDRGTLSDMERRAIDAALASDPTMARELELIRLARAALAVRDPAVDTDRIVAAIPRPVRTRRATGIGRWSVAASIATLIVGGASLVVVKQQFATRNDSAVVSESLQVASANGAAQPIATSFGYDLSELGADDLAQVMAEMEKFDGMPAATHVARAVVPVAEGGK